MWVRPYPGRSRRRRQAVAPIVGSVLACWLILIGAMALDGGAMKAADRANETFTAPVRQLAALLAGTSTSIDYDAIARELDIPQLKLMVAPQHLARLTRHRRLALRDRILIAGSSDFVPGKLESESGLHRVKLRLKGDNVDHLESDQWSLRIKVRDGFVHGMRTLSLQGSATRGGHGELLLLQMMRNAGILAPRSFFVRVVLNDRDLGLMVLEEHFNKELLESQGRREGVIMAFDEDLVWRQRREYNRRAQQGRAIPDAHKLPLDEVPWMPLRVFGAGSVKDNPILHQQQALATSLLRAYIAGTIPAEQVFDMRLLARHHVICNLWGAQHGYVAHNFRFYFNPITRLFEIIAFDNNTKPSALRKPPEWSDAPFTTAWTSPIFRAECMRFLKATATTLRGPRFERIRAADQHYVRCVEANGRRLTQRYGIDELPRRCDRLHQILSARSDPPQTPLTPPPQLRPGDAALVLAHARWIGRTLELQPLTPSPIVLVSATWRHGGRAVPLLDRPVTLPSGTHSIPVNANSITDAGRIEVVTQLAAGGTPVTHHARRSSLARMNHPLRKPGTPARFRAGVHNIDQELVVSGLHLEAGATLQFGRQGRIVVCGDVHIQGQPTTRVEMRGGALIVLGSGHQVRARHFHVRASAGVSEPDWTLTGGVTIHDCDVELVDCSFGDNACEDALNLIHCRFDLTRCRFENTPSDALDVDFGRGQIADCSFLGVGGDAVDLSGATVKIEGLDCQRVHDKALSIGEGADCTAIRVTAADVGVAAACKDGSTLSIEGLHANDVKVATLMAYIKKPAFGPPRLVASQVNHGQTARKAIAQRRCELSIDGAAIPQEDLNVDRLYHAGPMRK